MKIASLFKVLMGILTLGLVSCGSFIGPAFPEKHGREFLEKKKYPAEVIDAVVEQKDMSRSDFDRLAKEKDSNVLFLLGRNPHVPADILDKLTRHDYDFVRGGAATNPTLTTAQIEAFTKDPSVTTQGYLAENPKVPQKILLDLHYKQEVPLVNFAMNPNCPPQLKKKMRDEKDELALHWLKETEAAR